MVSGRSPRGITTIRSGEMKGSAGADGNPAAALGHSGRGATIAVS